MIKRITIHQYRKAYSEPSNKSDIIWYYSGLMNTIRELSEVDKLEVWI